MAQIFAMSMQHVAASWFSPAVRIVHFFTCAVAAIFAVNLLGTVPTLLGPNLPFRQGPDVESLAWTALALLVYGATAARAAWRVARRRALLDDTRIAEHPVLAANVTLGSLFAHFLVATVFHAVWSTYPDFDGNAAGPLALAGMLYAFALLTGEFVLVASDGNGELPH
jgi:hypothetical protein